jgi:antitoxin component of MazEF toxin-antitoxin module
LLRQKIGSEEGQVRIPKSVLDLLNFDAGTEVSIDVQGESLVMKRLMGNVSDWRTMRGMA